MGVFDKVTKTAADIGKSVGNSAAKVGSSAAVTAQEKIPKKQSFTFFCKFPLEKPKKLLYNSIRST